MVSNYLCHMWLLMQRLRIRHILDVMHCEKNICENILKYLLGERDKPHV